jgi:rare lipoprotein A (peptidoglycan hydrolase)
MRVERRRDQVLSGPVVRGLALALAILAGGAAPALADTGHGWPTAFHVEGGEASYYGPGFHGRRTASGARFDSRRLTAAHPSLPLGTKVVVTNVENGRQIEVEINDRGPYAKGRVIDLSEAAARRIGITRRSGTAAVLLAAADAAG